MKRTILVLILIMATGLFYQSCTNNSDEDIQTFTDSDIRKDSIIVPPGG